MMSSQSKRELLDTPRISVLSSGVKVFVSLRLDKLVHDFNALEPGEVAPVRYTAEAQDAAVCASTPS